MGAVKGPLGWDDKTVALSGDGALIVGKTNKKMIEVRATRTGKIAQTFDAESPFVDFIEFAGPDRVVYRPPQRPPPARRRREVGRQAERDLRIGERVPSDGIAISPGGNYLAAASIGAGRLEVFEVATGNVVGELPTPRRNGSIIHVAGVAYADDGSEIAGLFESFGAYSLVIWDAASGRMLDQFDLGKTVQKPTFYKDRAVEYFPDKAALLVMGSAASSTARRARRSGTSRSTTRTSRSARATSSTPTMPWSSRSAPGMALRTAEIPRDKIAAAATIVREGGNAADAALPPLKPVDLGAAKRVDLAGSPGAWTVAHRRGEPRSG